MTADEEQPEKVAELMDAIDDTLKWSSRTIGELIRIGEAKVYLNAGGPVEIAARRVLGVVPLVEEGAPELPSVVARVRRAAEAAVE